MQLEELKQDFYFLQGLKSTQKLLPSSNLIGMINTSQRVESMQKDCCKCKDEMWNLGTLFVYLNYLYSKAKCRSAWMLCRD